MVTHYYSKGVNMNNYATVTTKPMKTEDIKLDIKEIFERKKMSYHKHDIARMRYLCQCFIEYIIEYQKNRIKGVLSANSTPSNSFTENETNNKDRRAT